MAVQAMTFALTWWVFIPLSILLYGLCALAWRATRDGQTWLRRGLLVTGVLLLGLTPAHQTPVAERETNAEYFFIVDLTGSMAAQDYDGTEERLEGVRADITDIVDTNPGARYSIIAFSSTATEQLPLTTDARAVRSWVDAARRESTNYSAGSSLNRPRDALRDALERARDNNPQNVRIALFFTDGENTENTDIDYGSVADLVDAGYVFGYGTEDGAPMLRSFWGEEDAGVYITDPETGEDAISRIDPENLRTLAEQLGLDYVHRTQPGGAGALVADIPTEIIAGDGRRTIETPILWPIGLLLTGLVAWELWYLTPLIVSMRRTR